MKETWVRWLKKLSNRKKRNPFWGKNDADPEPTLGQVLQQESSLGRRDENFKIGNSKGQQKGKKFNSDLLLKRDTHYDKAFGGGVTIRNSGSLLGRKVYVKVIIYSLPRGTYDWAVRFEMLLPGKDRIYTYLITPGKWPRGDGATPK